MAQLLYSHTILCFTEERYDDDRALYCSFKLRISLIVIVLPPGTVKKENFTTGKESRANVFFKSVIPRNGAHGRFVTFATQF